MAKPDESERLALIIEGLSEEIQRKDWYAGLLLRKIEEMSRCERYEKD